MPYFWPLSERWDQISGRIRRTWASRQTRITPYSLLLGLTLALVVFVGCFGKLLVVLPGRCAGIGHRSTSQRLASILGEGGHSGCFRNSCPSSSAPSCGWGRRSRQLSDGDRHLSPFVPLDDVCAHLVVCWIGRIDRVCPETGRVVAMDDLANRRTAVGRRARHGIGDVDRVPDVRLAGESLAVVAALKSGTAESSCISRN